MNVSDYSTAELVAELIHRKVIRMHRLFTVDKINIGKRPSEWVDPKDVGVRFSQKARFRYFVNLPDIDLDIDPDKTDLELVREKVTAELIEQNRGWVWEDARSGTLSPGE